MFGYARCSTQHQDAIYEINELVKLGVKRENIYIEYISGGKTRDERPEYDKLMRKLEENPGSILISTDFTRLARNNLDIYNLTKDMEKLKYVLRYQGLLLIVEMMH